MGRKSPRVGKDARAGKSIAADSTAHNTVTWTRKAGRHCGDGLGFPDACSALSPSPLSPCRAELRGRSCLACIREGNWPMPVDWREGAASVASGRSVQAMRSASDGTWRVVVFLTGRMIDARYPVIACRSRGQAVELCHARARQLDPYGKLQQIGDGDWRLGNILIWVLGNGC